MALLSVRLAAAGVTASALCGACSVFPESAPAGGGAGGDSADGAATGGAAGSAPDASGGGSADGSSGADGTAGSGGAVNADAATGGSGGSVGTGGSTGSDAGLSEVSYVANVTDCLAEATPGTSICESYATSTDGPDEIWIDVRRPGLKAFIGYASFVLDSTLAGRTVDGVRLELTVTTHPNAAGSAPEVWAVTPFTHASLSVQVPLQVGTVPLAAGGAAAAKGETVTYLLPGSAIGPSAPLYLGLFAVGTDGIGLWDSAGDASTQVPPRLVVSYR